MTELYTESKQSFRSIQTQNCQRIGPELEHDLPSGILRKAGLKIIVLGLVSSTVGLIEYIIVYNKHYQTEEEGMREICIGNKSYVYYGNKSVEKCSNHLKIDILAAVHM